MERSRFVALSILLLAVLALCSLPNMPAAAAPSAPDASVDCDIWWNEVLHDTFNSDYRSIVGAATTGQTVRLRLRVAQSDITSARVRVWDDRTNTQTYYNMSWDGTFDTDPVTYDWWFANIPLGAQTTVVYYFFEINDNGGGSCPGGRSPDTDYYVDDDVKFYGGGRGKVIDGYDDMLSFQITVYDPAFYTPSWLRSAVVYQVFPDRFRNDNAGNDPVQGGDWIYGQTVRKLNWTQDLCDPRSTCPNEYGNQFYGGDLLGITDQLDYLQRLGIKAIYLNPIFTAPSNHLYDTQDYMRIDPYFGDLAAWQTLASEAEARGIKIILDGVFNHVSSDSKYFDRYSRWDASGNLTSPSGPGVNDLSGACESTTSGWRSWFTFVTGTGKCYDGAPGSRTLDYTSWWGYDSLPKMNSTLAAVRNYIYAGGSGSVGRYWLSQGADGWRFDVGDEVDAGTGSGDSNGYWAGFRSAARTQYADAALLGEQWADASAWLVGDQWDSVMNYRFRSAVLSWLFDGCSGNGCTGGAKFQDNDSNDGSSSGAIQALTSSQFDLRLASIREDYPQPAWYAMMNLLGSHDTNRILFLLKKISNDNAATATSKFKLLGIMQFTYPGAPTLYYGDEAGLRPDGVWDGTWWQDDPYNRAPYPWADQGRTPDTALWGHFRRLAVLRGQYTVLQTGDLKTLLADDANKVYSYARTVGTTNLAVTILNRDGASAHTVSVSGLDSAFNGKTLYNVLGCSGSPVTCPSYTVSGGSIANVSVSALNGAVLVEGPLPPYTVSVSVADDDILAGGSTSVVATVTNIGGALAADGTVVNLALLCGSGSLSSGTATVSGGNGQASVTYNAPGSGRTVAIVQATAGSYAWARGTAAVYVGNSADVVVQAVDRLTIGPMVVDYSAQSSVNLRADKAGLGEPTQALARYNRNPISGQADGNAYYDVRLDGTAGLDSLKVRFFYYTDAGESNNKLYWYDGTTWAQVMGAVLYPAPLNGGYMEFTFTSSSTPSLANLNATPFGLGLVGPTAVKLISFAGRPAAGGLLLSWETASEENNVGFNLYRSTAPGAAGVQLNTVLIPSRAPGGGQGASYTFLDTTALLGVTYSYTLEDVDVNGVRTPHGPVAVALWRAYLPLVTR